MKANLPMDRAPDSAEVSQGQQDEPGDTPTGADPGWWTTGSKKVEEGIPHQLHLLPHGGRSLWHLTPAKAVRRWREGRRLRRGDGLTGLISAPASKRGQDKRGLSWEDNHRRLLPLATALLLRQAGELGRFTLPGRPSNKPRLRRVKTPLGKRGAAPNGQGIARPHENALTGVH